jgi:hypothetical protein
MILKMKSLITDHYVTKAQNSLYQKLNTFSKSHNYLGRVVSIPVAFTDVALEFLKNPLRIIERIAFVGINLFGVTFNERCSLKDAICNAEYVLGNITCIPVAIVMTPVKLAFQILSGLYDAQNVTSINWLPHLGDDKQRLIYPKKTI